MEKALGYRERVLRFFVSGKPVPKRRPRAGQGHFYTPEATRQWEAQIEAAALEAVAKSGGRPPLFTGPVALSCIFYRDGVHVAVTLLEGKAPAGADVDNLVKSVLDAIQGPVVANDRQVVSLEASRQPRKRPRQRGGAA